MRLPANGMGSQTTTNVDPLLQVFFLTLLYSNNPIIVPWRVFESWVTAVDPYCGSKVRRVWDRDWNMEGRRAQRSFPSAGVRPTQSVKNKVHSESAEPHCAGDAHSWREAVTLNGRRPCAPLRYTPVVGQWHGDHPPPSSEMSPFFVPLSYHYVLQMAIIRAGMVKTCK